MNRSRSKWRFRVGEGTSRKTHVVCASVMWREQCEFSAVQNGDNDNSPFFGNRELSTHNAIVEKMLELDTSEKLGDVFLDPVERQHLRNWAESLSGKIASGAYDPKAVHMFDARDLAFIHGLRSILS